MRRSIRTDERRKLAAAAEYTSQVKAFGGARVVGAFVRQAHEALNGDRSGSVRPDSVSLYQYHFARAAQCCLVGACRYPSRASTTPVRQRPASTSLKPIIPEGRPFSIASGSCEVFHPRDQAADGAVIEQHFAGVQPSPRFLRDERLSHDTTQVRGGMLY